jgi:hypothetical protein
MQRARLGVIKTCSITRCYIVYATKRGGLSHLSPRPRHLFLMTILSNTLLECTLLPDSPAIQPDCSAYNYTLHTSLALTQPFGPDLVLTPTLLSPSFRNRSFWLRHLKDNHKACRVCLTPVPGANQGLALSPTTSSGVLSGDQANRQALTDTPSSLAV